MITHYCSDWPLHKRVFPQFYPQKHSRAINFVRLIDYVAVHHRVKVAQRLNTFSQYAWSGRLDLCTIIHSLITFSSGRTVGSGGADMSL